MKRQVSLEEISDGRLYSRNDMVKAGCGGCKGCSDCCRGMGNSVILDPLDIYRLTTGLGLGFDALMADKIELNVVDGIILPNLKMGSGSETCAFLNREGRCSIHPYRPGICRLFPLGRYYETRPASESGQNPGRCFASDSGQNPGRCFASESGQNPGRCSASESGRNPGRCFASDSSRSGAQIRSFRYFLQVHECPVVHKTKVKVEKWIDTPNVSRYEKFVNDWHYFLEDVQERLQQEADDVVKNANLFLLKLFYIRPYDGGADFYAQFEERLAQAREVLEVGDAVNSKHPPCTPDRTSGIRRSSPACCYSSPDSSHWRQTR